MANRHPLEKGMSPCHATKERILKQNRNNASKGSLKQFDVTVLMSLLNYQITEVDALSLSERN